MIENLNKGKLYTDMTIAGLGTVAVMSIPILSALYVVSLFSIGLIGIMFSVLFVLIFSVEKKYKLFLAKITAGVLGAFFLFSIKGIISGFAEIAKLIEISIIYYRNPDSIRSSYYGMNNSSSIFTATMFVTIVVAFLVTLQVLYFRNILGALIAVGPFLGFFVANLLIPETFSIILCVTYILSVCTIREKNYNVISSYIVICLTVLCSLILMIFMPKATYTKPILFTQMYQAIDDLMNSRFSISLGGGASGGVSEGLLGQLDGISYNNSVIAHLTTVSTGKSQYIRHYSGIEYTRNSWIAEDAEAVNTGDAYMQYTFLQMDGSSAVRDYVGNNQAGFDYYNNFMLYPYSLATSKYSESKYACFANLDFKDYSVFENIRLAQPNGEEYERYVYENFVKLPDDTRVLINSLVSKPEGYENTTFANRLSVEQTADYINYIRDFLKQNYEYSLNPGKLPDEKDFVTYFLTENKTGYCTYFATAATLMFRNAGIPARYCEGFYVKDEDIIRGDVSFEEITRKNIDGKDNTISLKTYKINVRDTAAHAWVQVFISGFGWVDVEVTPGYTSNVASGGYDNTEKENEYIKPVEEETEPDENIEEQENSDDDNTEETTQTPNENNSDESDSRLNVLIIGALVFLAVITVIFIIISVIYLVRYSKRKSLLRYKAKDSSRAIELYYYLERLLNELGYSRNEALDYEDFARFVCFKDDFFKDSKLEEVVDIILMLRFSKNATITKGQFAMLAKLVVDSRRYILDDMTFFKKMYVVLVKGL